MPEKPAQALAEQVETTAVDHLHAQPMCERCGYNLHTQRIILDLRTAVAVVRCPECGLIRPVNCLSHSGIRWPQGPRSPSNRLPVMAILLLVLCSLTAYYLYEKAPRPPVPGANPLGIIGICADWALASVPLTVALLLALSQLHQAGLLARVVALTAAVLLGYVGHRKWVAASGGILRPGRADLDVAVLCHVVLAAALAAGCRPAMRALVRVVFPPAARGVFESFWEMDGLAVPLEKP